MYKVLISYSTKGGNTEKLAKAIAKGVESVDNFKAVVKRAKDTTTEDLVEADGIIIGSPVYFGTVSAEVKDLIDRSVAVRRKLINKVGAAFTTSGHLTGGKELTIFSILAAMLIHEMIIVGDPIEAGGHFGAACTGTPTPSDENNGEALGKRVASVINMIKKGDKC
jgi:NAD(P)H dehydrogenase (quinone)